MNNSFTRVILKQIKKRYERVYFVALWIGFDIWKNSELGYNDNICAITVARYLWFCFFCCNSVKINRKNFSPNTLSAVFKRHSKIFQTFWQFFEVSFREISKIRRQILFPPEFRFLRKSCKTRNFAYFISICVNVLRFFQLGRNTRKCDMQILQLRHSKNRCRHLNNIIVLAFG